jgi:spermidine/putrescine transport system permease protein
VTATVSPATRATPPADRPAARAPRRGPLLWLREHIVPIVAALAFCYMLLPNVIVVLFSFNNPAGRYNYSWQEFSLDAWKDPCGPAGLCSSLGLSLRISLLATLLATALGTLAAFAMARHRYRGRSTSNVLVFLPMATPEVVMGSSLLAMFVSTGVERGLGTIIIAHILFNISFVVVTVRARLAGFNRNLEEAGMDLGADEWTTFWKVTFPLIFPGILAAGMLAFALSIDDFVITQFTAGPDQTFPLWVYGASRIGVPPEVNVMGTIIFGVAILGIVTWSLLQSRDQLAAAARQPQ